MLLWTLKENGFLFFLGLLGLYIFYFSSLHSLIILLFVEILVLSVLLFLYMGGLTWFFCLMFLLIAVCLGAYGVSLLVSISRGKGLTYYFSF